jgi:hypothetical protein
MIPILYLIFGAAGLLLAFFKVSGGYYVLWAFSLLLLNLWITEGEKIKRRVFKIEDSGSSKTGS